MQAALSTTEASVRKDLAHSGSQAQPSLLSLRTAMRHPDQALQDAALVLEAAQGVRSGASYKRPEPALLPTRARLAGSMLVL